jgi:hypothetical protein
MEQPVKKIAVVQGAPGVQVQALLATLADRWRGLVRLAGVVAEDHGLPDRACSAGYLRSLSDDRRFAMFQDLGPGSAGCHLDGAGVTQAADAVQRDIAQGCDLVVLSKFGKLEAGGGGLRDAFSAAIEAGIPVLTSVSTALQEPWQRFAAPMFAIVPAEAERIEAWWREVRPRTLAG